jgi:hypothetical protein
MMTTGGITARIPRWLATIVHAVPLWEIHPPIGAVDLPTFPERRNTMWTESDIFMTIASFGFWVPAALAWRSHTRATRVLAAQKHQKVQEQITAPVEAVETATQKGPGIMYRSTLLFFKGIKWTTPRLFAGIKKVSRFTFMMNMAGGKAAVGKYQAYLSEKVTKAKAAAIPAVPVSPVVDWDQYDGPAFMRVKNTSENCQSIN